MLSHISALTLLRSKPASLTYVLVSVLSHPTSQTDRIVQRRWLFTVKDMSLQWRNCV